MDLATETVLLLALLYDLRVQKMVSEGRFGDGLLVVCLFLGLLCIHIADGIVTVSSSSHATPQSSNTNITCFVTGDTFVGWLNPIGQSIPSDDSKRIHVVSSGARHDLIIKDVQMNDEGTYQCQAGSTSLPVTIYVEYPPKVLRSLSTNSTQWTSYTDPNPVQIRCAFNGYPVPSIEISKDNKLITKGVTRRSGSLTYKFQAKTIDDYGFYACRGTNSQGDDTYYVEVSKTGLPDPPGNITLWVGCDYITVKWIPPLTDRGSPITSYRIELLHNGDTIRGDILSSSEREKTFFQLEKVTSYRVRINAKNDMGNGTRETHAFETKATCTSGKTNAASMTLLILAMVLSMIIETSSV
ncbi:myosin-binding protein C, slow-type-like [Actinia tenebrosa]|uniref:Myosin-binding protein C, slow-type-like n=1 Tax=Actinia tenebrosa TaxID=6105 RepID=A0A6P8IRS5_ACTTE|nr:myosin-binding protein C, slow-type-like [Actinia tenebrosa]